MGIEAPLRRIVREIMSGWDHTQTLYTVDALEINSLLEAGAEIINLNEDKGDGLYYHELKACGSRFKGSTLKPL